MFLDPGDSFVVLLCFLLDFVSGGARGSQRERDRERAAARKPNSKNGGDGLTPEQRRERFVSFSMISDWFHHR
jgi:hypothetical protein